MEMKEINSNLRPSKHQLHLKSIIYYNILNPKTEYQNTFEHDFFQIVLGVIKRIKKIKVQL